MSEPKHTEVFGLVSNGEWVHLGNVKMTEEEIQDLLEALAGIYGQRGSGWFNVGQAVFDAAKLLGVRVK